MLNAVLAVFNLFPIPPLDGGRILVAILPQALATPCARLEPYGLAILIGLFIVLPVLGAQLGVDLSVVSQVFGVATGAIIEAIVHVTGHQRTFRDVRVTAASPSKQTLIRGSCTPASGQKLKSLL